MKTTWPVLGLCLCLVFCSLTQAQLLPPGATAQLLDGNFKFTESPLYDGNGGVYFSDLWPSNNQAAAPSRLYRYEIATDTSTIVDANSGSANGTIMDSMGRMLSADRDRRQISRRSVADVSVVETVLADKYMGTAFNGPNDLAMDAAGGIYFTDPDYENRHALTDAFYYLSPTGTLTQLRTFTLSSNRRPNGIVLSPDGLTLYVAIETGKHIMAYDVAADGSISNDHEFGRTDITIGGTHINPPVGPDGLTIDAAGNVYAAAQNAVFAWNPAGVRLFDLAVAEDPTNVDIGGPNGRTLFIAAGKSLYSTELNVPTPQNGDYNGDGTVDAADYTVWRNTLGGTANLSADGNGNRVIDAGDYEEWKSKFGTVLGSGASNGNLAVPEPGVLPLLIAAVCCIAGGRRKRQPG